MEALSCSVIVADDQPAPRALLRQAVLAAVPEAIVVEADCLAVLRRAAGCHGTALVLLKPSLPGMEGFVSLRTLRAEFPDLRIALISAPRSRLRVRAAQALGAVGYLYKSPSAEQLQLSLRRLLAGGSCWPLPPAQLRDGTLEERLGRLSPQELRILLCLRGGGRNRQIADELAISESTVKSHVSAILHKLGLYSRTQAALLAQRLLSLPDDAPY